MSHRNRSILGIRALKIMNIYIWHLLVKLVFLRRTITFFLRKKEEVISPCIKN